MEYEFLVREKGFYSSPKRFIVAYIFDIQAAEVLSLCLT